MIAGFLPAFIFLNWLNLIWAGIGIALGFVALLRSQPRQNGPEIMAIVANGVPIVIGILRIAIGNSPL